uniref:Testis expressed 9 n=1 Tax=Astyanax mexicanus TaxID=7994 RepID=W5LLJ6_ASTMX
MAERPTSAPQRPKKPQSPCSQKPPMARPVNRPSTAPQKKPPAIDLLAKEEEYKRLNAELEAKTAELVRQAEEVMREQNEVLSKPFSTHLSISISEDYEDVGDILFAVKKPTAKAVTDKKSIKATRPSRPPSGHKKISQKTKPTMVDDVAVPDDFGDFSLAKTISNIEGRVSEDVTDEHLEDDIMPSVGEEMGAESQIRFLKAKLRVMQEELNRLSHECNKKDDENGVLSSKLKEVEDERLRLQKTTSVQQTQLEKHRALAEEANRNCDGLRHQVGALQKELEGMKRAQKQASSSHSAMEVRLNRALEEAEKSKAQLGKIKQSSKDSANQEQQRIEMLQAENKKLEKQKAELIIGFKKQLKLIDILKRQKMHFEAAKMLSFTEEEFMKALDWGKP